MSITRRPPLPQRPTLPQSRTMPGQASTNLRHRSLALGLSLLLVVAAGWPLAAEASRSSSDTPAAQSDQDSKPRKAKRSHRPAKASQQPWGETAAQKERRLRRECYGRPNAGACLGYTR